MIVDQNEWFRGLNAGLPDDVARLKAAGYYREAIERIDAYLAEDWTAVQNGPNAGANPAPGGVDTWRAALRAEISPFSQAALTNSNSSGRSFGLLPKRTPRASAAAIPSAWRRRMKARSVSAT